MCKREIKAKAEPQSGFLPLFDTRRKSGKQMKSYTNLSPLSLLPKIPRLNILPPLPTQTRTIPPIPRSSPPLTPLTLLLLFVVRIAAPDRAARGLVVVALFDGSERGLRGVGVGGVRGEFGGRWGAGEGGWDV